MKNLSMFDDQKMTLKQALALTAESLNEYGKHYNHWCIAYSGGKDSTATVAAVTYLILSGKVTAPKSLTILYADTRQELPPLAYAAKQMMEALRERGHRVIEVLPKLDDRYMVYILGRGVPPPNNATLRWCTAQLKIEPMHAAIETLSTELGGEKSDWRLYRNPLQHEDHSAFGAEKILMLTGVRIGESAARDARITASCSRNGAECGQGWFQLNPPKAVSDTLAPLLHWRVCHVWDWLTFGWHGLPTQFVAEAYGGDEAQELNARTGCIGCPLASKETALETVLSLPQWAYLHPLRRLKPLYTELRERRDFRLRKVGERNKNGKLSSNPNRLGPLTMQARRYGLGVVLGVQEEINAFAIANNRPTIDLINPEELARINELIANNTWPQRWTGDEVRGDVLVEQWYGNGSVQDVIHLEI